MPQQKRKSTIDTGSHKTLHRNSDVLHSITELEHVCVRTKTSHDANAMCRASAYFSLKNEVVIMCAFNLGPLGADLRQARKPAEKKFRESFPCQKVGKYGHSRAETVENHGTEGHDGGLDEHRLIVVNTPLAQ